MMSGRNELGFLLVSVIGIVLVATLVTTLPAADWLGVEVAAEASSQPVSVQQESDPGLLVPESTMLEKPEQYVPRWDDNPVATIPESILAASLGRYGHDWDDNPVATIPESTMGEESR